MNKLFLLLALSMTTLFAKAQDNLVSVRFAAPIYFTSPLYVNMGPGISYQRSLGEKLTVGINADFLIASTAAISITTLSFEPRIDYFFNESFNGMHIGSKLAYGSATGGGGLLLGANFGYMIGMGENFKLDLAVAPAFSLGLGTLGTSNFALVPAVAFGYAF